MRGRLLRLLFLRDVDDLFAVVPAALHAHPMRGTGLAAVGAGTDGGRLDAGHPLGAARIAPCARLSTLLNRHLHCLSIRSSNLQVTERRELAWFGAVPCLVAGAVARAL